MRKLFLLTLTVIIALGSTLFTNGLNRTEASIVFNDTNRQEILHLEREGIVTGFPGRMYRPEQRVTRAEAATMIGRALQLNGEKRETQFPDVPKNHFASGYIQSAVEAGIITGYPSGFFGLNDHMTREQMAHLLTRAFELNERSVVVFSDVFPVMVSFEAINKLATSKITTGYPDGTFRPRNHINRLEFGLLLARALYPEYQGQVTAAFLQPMFEVVVDAPNGLNVRPDPSTTRAPLGQLAHGTETSVFLIIGNWAYVASEQMIGFVSLRHINAKPISNELAGKTLVVDPGHGGTDPGAIGHGLREKDLVLDVGILTRLKLQSAGARVVMTRDSDVFVTLDGRVAIAEQAKANAFISIHANSSTSSAAHGTETFWNSTFASKESRELAESIQKHLIKNLKTRDRGAKQANFRVITATTMPSVLVELGFISNQAEAERMKTDQFKQDAADAIFQGVIDFYK